MRTPATHRLSGNALEDSPHEVIVIDTETRMHGEGTCEVHTLRCWAAVMMRRHGRNPSRPRREAAEGLGAPALADWLESRVRTTPTVWVYTHNLSFDLSVTRLPLLLVDRGWQITQHNLASDAPWARLVKGGKAVKLCDSASMLPYSVAHLGAHLGMGKLELPDQDEGDQAWLARCRRDVEITAAALEQAMDWWDARELGHWSSTGPRTGWNAYRHLCIPGREHRVIEQRGPGTESWISHGHGFPVIDPDPDARMFERSALCQGRREAWRLGQLPEGTYAELDFRHAYLSVAQHFPLPCRRGLAFESLECSSRYVDDPNLSIIAQVTLRTAVPRYPLRGRAGITYPVGTFTTVLCGPEIAEARRRGELVAIGAGYYYRLSWHMQPWADAMAAVIDAPEGRHPAMGVLLCKAWSRTVFGVWAARRSNVVIEGTSPEGGWHAEHGTDTQSGAKCTILNMAGRWQYIVRDQEADDSFPGVLAWVQSHIRVALGAVVDQIPDRYMVNCSTDSVLVQYAGYAVALDGRPGAKGRRAQVWESAHMTARRLSAFVPGLELRPKALYSNVRVLSAQHLKLDDEIRMAGISKSAQELAPDRFVFYTWPKMARQLELDEPRGYVRQHREVDLREIRVNRWAAEDGCTSPPEAVVGPDGTTVLLGPPGDGCIAHGAPWKARQWPDLARAAADGAARDQA